MTTPSARSSRDDVVAATRAYEAWLARHVPLVEADLAFKHEQMATALFPFLRATFYRWVQLWPRVCPDLAAAPHALVVGDVHLENFGTWRDIEGRLVWGVNDFDEAYPMAYTNDLVRLATSVRLARDAGSMVVRGRRACAAILDGYRSAIHSGGRPFVLEDGHRVLRGEALSELRDPVHFWERMSALPDASAAPREALAVLHAAMPGGVSARHVARRAGLGSLGHPRIVALAEWGGGRVAREAKALTPSACAWAVSAGAPAPVHYRAVVTRAVRCPDPFLLPHRGWLVRRLSPDCSRIEATAARTRPDQEELLRAMGWETANIHLGTPGRRIAEIDRDLDRRPDGWLHDAAGAMERAVHADFDRWSAVARPPASV